MTVLILKGLDTISVSRRLNALGMTPPSEPEINEKRTEIYSMFTKEEIEKVCPPSKLEYAKVIEKHKAEIEAIGVGELYPVLLNERFKDWEDVMYLISDQRVRIAVHSLMLFGFENLEICKVLKSRHGIDIPERSVALFEKYMWDIKRMTSLEVYAYIESVPTVKHRNQYTDAFHKTGEVVEWRFAGKSVVNLETILKEVMNEAFIKFREAAKSDDVKEVGHTAKWADLAMKAAEKYEKLTGSSKKDSIAQLRFELQKLRQADIPVMDNDPREVV